MIDAPHCVWQYLTITNYTDPKKSGAKNAICAFCDKSFSGCSTTRAAAHILGRPVLGQIKAVIHPCIVINKKDDYLKTWPSLVRLNPLVTQQRRPGRSRAGTAAPRGTRSGLDPRRRGAEAHLGASARRGQPRRCVSGQKCLSAQFRSEARCPSKKTLQIVTC